MASDYILNAVALSMISYVGYNVLVILISMDSDGYKTNQCHKSFKGLCYVFGPFAMLKAILQKIICLF